MRFMEAAEHVLLGFSSGIFFLIKKNNKHCISDDYLNY